MFSLVSVVGLFKRWSSSNMFAVKVGVLIDFGDWFSLLSLAEHVSDESVYALVLFDRLLRIYGLILSASWLLFLLFSS